MDTLLQTLISCHSTPGDEGEVRRVLERCWCEEGWSVERHGDYAVSATEPLAPPSGPVLLICAHMDSPGYAVDRVFVKARGRAGHACFGVTELGSPEFDGDQVSAEIKTRRGRFCGTLRRFGGPEEETDLVLELAEAEAAAAEVRHGDRVCFSSSCEQEASLLIAPFLDNRLGCLMLARLAAEARTWNKKYRVVLGATGSEEAGGFGARVLASRVRPDLAVVLDTTYEAEEQGVFLGRGPVLTLSDASVLLSPDTRDRVLALLAQGQVPVQTEVYNFSGTDARAFPQSGLTCPVLPLLAPTRGNHSPCETADVRDLDAWLAAVRTVAERY